MIRSKLKCEEDEQLKIHPGLVTSLLEIDRYTHGSRSLCKLLEPFIELRLSDKRAPLRLSDLPPPDQLGLHVEIDRFNRLTERDAIAAEQLGVKELASAVHQFYRELGEKGGWLDPHQDCELEELSQFLQASNVAAARRIPAVLGLVGLALAKGATTPNEAVEANAIIERKIELLAEAEHDGWMEWHFNNGWSHSDVRNDAKLQHKTLAPFNDLPEKEKEKDRHSIRRYADIVKLANMKIVRKSRTAPDGDEAS